MAELNKLPQAVRSKVMNGTAEERTAALDAMDPETRTKVLGGAAAQRDGIHAQV